MEIGHGCSASSRFVAGLCDSCPCYDLWTHYSNPSGKSESLAVEGPSDSSPVVGITISTTFNAQRQ
eukprot:4882181-Amphidinium_carterae.2